MTDQQLSELLAHPRVRTYMERIAEDAALRAVAKARIVMRKANTVLKPRPSAKGDVNYHVAALIIGCPYSSVRGYLCAGKLTKGKLYGTVSLQSCLDFKANYKPRYNARITNP